MPEHRLAKVLAFLIFCLILLGGIVHNTGSSLACPDWPLCFGSLMPEMKGSVAIEHSHRLFAASVGLLTIVQAVLLWKRRKNDPTLRRLGIVAVCLVVFQGVLGGVAVIYRLPALVSTAHLGISMIFFAVIIVIAWALTRPSATLSREGRGFILLTTLLLYLQILLGAFVRHTGAGLICPDIPYCNGSLWPSDLHPMFRLHMAHRWLGVLVALMVISLPVRLRKSTRSPWILALSLAASIIVIFQIILGIDTILTQKAVVTVTAHLGGAALLWAAMVSLCFLMKRSPL